MKVYSAMDASHNQEWSTREKKCNLFLLYRSPVLSFRQNTTVFRSTDLEETMQGACDCKLYLSDDCSVLTPNQSGFCALMTEQVLKCTISLQGYKLGVKSGVGSILGRWLFQVCVLSYSLAPDSIEVEDGFHNVTGAHRSLSGILP